MSFKKSLERRTHPRSRADSAREAQEALSEYSKANYDSVIALTSQIVALDPEYEYPFFLRGCAYFQKGDYESAVSDFTEALRYDPNNHPILYNRAVAHQKLNNVDKAIADFEAALVMKPRKQSTIDALVSLGTLRASKGEIEKAEDAYQEAVRLSADNQENIYGRAAFAFLDINNYERAIYYFTHVIELNPKNALAFGNRGYAYIKQHKLELALFDIEETLRLTPDEALAYNNRGVIRFQTGDNEGAESDYRRALEIEPDFPSPYVGLGCVAFVRGEYQAALKYLQKASEPKPNKHPSDTALAGMAIVHHALGQVDEALKLWRDLIESDAHFQQAAWLQTEYGWTVPLIEEAAKIISKL